MKKAVVALIIGAMLCCGFNLLAASSSVYADTSDKIQNATVTATVAALNNTATVLSKVADMPGLQYLSLLGTVLQITQMFSGQPDPVMTKLNAMSQQLTQLQSDVKNVQNQNIDLGVQVTASDMLTILNKLDDALKKITIANGVDSAYYNASVYCNRYDANAKANPLDPSSPDCTAENYRDAMQGIYRTAVSADGVTANTTVLDAYRDLAEITTGTQSVWNNKNICDVMTIYLSARRNYNTQTIDKRQNLITSIQNTVSTVGTFLLRAIFYDQTLNQKKVDSLKQMLQENSKDPTNTDESYYRNAANSTLSSSDVFLANSIINDAQNAVDYINNDLLYALRNNETSSTKPNDVASQLSNVNTVLTSAQAALTNEENDVISNNRIYSYRLSRLLNKVLTGCPAENYVRLFCGYHVESWETSKFRSNTADQQYALNNHVSVADMNTLKNSAESRATHLADDMIDAGFNFNPNHHQIAFGAHANPSSGYRKIYIDFIHWTGSETDIQSAWAINYYDHKKSQTQNNGNIDADVVSYK